MKNKIKVVGGGLAGTEAAYQLLKRGFSVELYEMRPHIQTPAHKTAMLAELICSNSLKSTEITTAQGLLKAEMRLMDSLVLKAAENSSVPAGSALAVDRELFSAEIEKRLNSFDGFKLIREEAAEIDDSPAIIATGPLTSDRMAAEIARVTGAERLSFYDAVAPIVTAESVDKDKSYYMSRYGKGDADYLNLPLTKEEYTVFTEELVKAERVITKEFEKGDIFEGCMPVEVMAKRGFDALRFGPLKPVGLGQEGNRPYAVVQLRKEDNYERLMNMVGFQTNLKFSEQKRVFSLIPALKNAEFVRYGVMHRNTYIKSPGLLDRTFALISKPGLYFAGQLTGVEGYLESAMSGLVAGINAALYLSGEKPFVIPSETMSGGLCKYIETEQIDFAPMHVSYELTAQPEVKIKDKQKRRQHIAERALLILKQALVERQLI